jgi:hypothetical protein
MAQPMHLTAHGCFRKVERSRGSSPLLMYEFQT